MSDLTTFAGVYDLIAYHSGPVKAIALHQTTIEALAEKRDPYSDKVYWKDYTHIYGLRVAVIPPDVPEGLIV